MAEKFTKEQLNNLDHGFLADLFLNLQDRVEELTLEVKKSNDYAQKIMEQLVLADKNRFGRSSEKLDDINQISFKEVDGMIVFFNEAEAVADLDAAEPDTLEEGPKKAKNKKQAGKKDADLKGLPINKIDHYLTEEELTAEFGPNGWKQLNDVISRHYRFIPAKVEADDVISGYTQVKRIVIS